MYLIRLPTTGTPPRSSSSLASARQHARPYLILAFSRPRASPVRDSCKRRTQFLFEGATPLARGTRIFLHPAAVPAELHVGLPRLQVAINFPSARERVLPVAINQTTEFQFGATSHAENSHYETHVVNQWNRSPRRWLSQAEKHFRTLLRRNVMDAHLFHATWRFSKSSERPSS